MQANAINSSRGMTSPAYLKREVLVWPQARGLVQHRARQAPDTTTRVFPRTCGAHRARLSLSTHLHSALQKARSKKCVMGKPSLLGLCALCDDFFSKSAKFVLTLRGEIRRTRFNAAR